MREKLQCSKSNSESRKPELRENGRLFRTLMPRDFVSEIIPTLKMLMNRHGKLVVGFC